MNLIVSKILVCFSCLYQQFQLLSTVMLKLDFTFLPKQHAKTSLKVFQYRFSTLVKRLQKQLAIEANFASFLQLSCSTFTLKLWEKPYIYQNCQEIRFEGLCGKFETKSCFQRQSFTKHLRQTQVLMWIRALRDRLNFYFLGNLLLALQKF